MTSGDRSRWKSGLAALAVVALVVSSVAGCDGDSSGSVAVTGVMLDKTTLALSSSGAPTALTASVAPADATDPGVTWTSSQPSVATVSSTGLVTPVGTGTTTITVTTDDGGFTASCTVTVASGTTAATGVTLDKTTLHLVPGGSASPLVASVLPANAADKRVIWSSSNTPVATVSAGGLVTPVAAGTATITVTTMDGGHTATCAVTVSVSVSSIMLDRSTLDLVVGGATGTIVATVLPMNATDKTVTWTSSNTAVATVGASGIVSPVAAGNATITATTADGGLMATVAVTVTPPVAVSGVTLNSHNLSLLTGGTPSTLVATVSPANAANKSVTWMSSNTGVATVSSTGVVTAVAVGNATITVTTVDGGLTDTCSVTVTNPAHPVTGVALDTHTLHVTFGGGTSTLVATVSPGNADDPSVTWSSSDTNVATVSSTGVVTAVGSGTATITVTTNQGSFTDTCSLTVDPDAPTALGATTPLSGQIVVTWTAPVDPNATGVRVSMTSLDGSATILPPQVVALGTAKAVLSGLSIPVAYTVSLQTVGASSTQSAVATVDATTTMVVRILRPDYTENNGSWKFILIDTNGSSGTETHDCTLARVDENIPKNYRWALYPGLADPADASLVSLMEQSYDAGTSQWVSTSRYLRIRSASAGAGVTNQGQWYGWATPNPNNHIAYADLDDASAAFEADATFRMVSGSVSGTVAFQWYPDTSYQLLHTYYHVMVQTAAVVGSRFDADSAWYLEDVSYRTP